MDEEIKALKILENRNLADIPNEELTGALPRIRELSSKVWAARVAVEALISERMQESKATKFVHNGITLTLQTQRTREFDDDKLQEIMPLIDEDERRNIVKGYKITWKWNGGLKELMKRGGKVLELINKAITVTEKPYLKIEKARHTISVSARVLPNREENNNE